MKSLPAILIVDDETRMLDILKINLSSDYIIYIAENGLEAKTIIENNPLDLVISDLKMPKMDGKQLFEFVKKNFPLLPFVIMTAFGSIEDAVEAIQQGAFHYIVKPVNMEDLRNVIEKALSFRKLVSENKKLKNKVDSLEKYHKIITADPQMKKLLDRAGQVARANANVLIMGESGTGKQLLAEFVHSMSPVSDGPFVEINAGAIPHELLESELFGHEKGAFTGAVQAKKGKFELAHNGTIFLDEIGELPLDLQVKLLHVVEQNKLVRVGGTKEININVRLITATNRNLKEEIENKRFRADLYYRLSVVSLNIPPLRQRNSDIVLLSNYFIEKHRQNPSINYRIDEEALEALRYYPWPGNIRELENVIQQALIFSPDGVITLKQLPPEITEKNTTQLLSKDALQKLRKEKTDKINKALELQFIDNILTAAKGNISRAAELSGYDRRQLQNLLAKHNINYKNYRTES